MMGQYRIPYNRSSISLNIPDDNVHYYIDLDLPDSGKSKKESLSEAIQNSKSGSLDDFVQNKRVGLIIEDATRDVPLEDLLEVSGSALKKASSITVFIATGTHDGDNDGNRELIDYVLKSQNKFGFTLEKIVVNDCDEDAFYRAGTTSSEKNDIFVHEDSRSADVFLVFSDMKNHYFAGYSNPIKNFMPGICNYPTTERNHALALDDNSSFGRHPLHPDPDRRNNPLATDMWEAYQLIANDRPTYVLATITKKRNILWSGAGLIREVMEKGILEVDRLMSMEVSEADKLIVSCGGYPNDESLYTAQRALELSKYGVKTGGDILFLAGCADGLGPQKSIKNFFEPLTDDIDSILTKLSDTYVMYSHKTYKFAKLIDQMSRIYLMSELSSELVQKIHLFPTDDPQILINQWLTQNPKVSIGIVTDGNKLALYNKA
jgi:nickel-dependent lactate racemase